MAPPPSLILALLLTHAHIHTAFLLSGLRYHEAIRINPPVVLCQQAEADHDEGLLRTNQLYLSRFKIPLAQRKQIFEHPKLFGISIRSRVEELTTHVGLRKRHLTHLMATKPLAFVEILSAGNLKPTLEIVRATLDLSDDEMRTLLHRLDGFHVRSLNRGDFRMIVRFLSDDLGFTREEVQLFSLRFPAALTMSMDIIRPRCRKLQELGHTPEELRRTLCKNPRILFQDFDKVCEIYTYLTSPFPEGLGMAQREACVCVSKNTRVLMCRISKLEDRVTEMAHTFGFTPDEIRRVSLRYPHHLTMPPSSLHSLFETLTRITSAPQPAIRRCIINFPNLMGLSVRSLERKLQLVAGFMRPAVLQRWVPEISSTIPASQLRGCILCAVSERYMHEILRQTLLHTLKALPAIYTYSDERLTRRLSTLLSMYGVVQCGLDELQAEASDDMVYALQCIRADPKYKGTVPLPLSSLLFAEDKFKIWSEAKANETAHREEYVVNDM